MRYKSRESSSRKNFCEKKKETRVSVWMSVFRSVRVLTFLSAVVFSGIMTAMTAYAVGPGDSIGKSETAAATVDADHAGWHG